VSNVEKLIPEGGFRGFKLFDTLVNLVSGLGTGKDKGAGFNTTYNFCPMTMDQALAAYRSSWIIRKAIDIPAKDMTRAWRTWHSDQTSVELIEQLETALFVQVRIQQAIQRGRLFGGCLLYMGIKGQDPSTPLNLKRVRKGDLQYLHVFSKWEVGATEIELDIMSPYYGQPKAYVVGNTGNNVIIDRSRVIRFVGNEIPSILMAPDGWGDSVIQTLDDAVKNADATGSGIASLVQEAKIDIIKVPDLMSNLSTAAYTQKLTQRFGLANTLKSINNMLLLDAEEEWERKELSFTQLPEVYKLFLEVVSGAADIPATRFLGQSPTGLNSSGESDLRNYYDRISADQNSELRPNLASLDEVIIRSALGSRPSDVYYTFSPLWQLSDTDKATVAQNKSLATKNLVSTNLLPNDVIRMGLYGQLIEDGIYPGLETAAEEYMAANGGSLAPPDDQIAPTSLITSNDPVDPAADPVDPQDPKGAKDPPDPTPAPKAKPPARATKTGPKK
jgi:phage-related protein (TIGR01555 family)